ncbi:MAG: DUF664 domain-containing protein [Acidimicrobiales bacterium]
MSRAEGQEIGFPIGNPDERELLISWLDYLRGAVVRKVEDLDDHSARWTPDGRLLSLLGIVNHLTNVEWRWLERRMQGEQVTRNEAEFCPGLELSVEAALAAYQARARATNAAVRTAPSLAVPCLYRAGTDLRWVILHLINETARHAGHADATRELLDGRTGT